MDKLKDLIPKAISFVKKLLGKSDVEEKVEEMKKDVDTEWNKRAKR